jgi:ribosome-associated translation inhibitor RaiA
MEFHWDHLNEVLPEKRREIEARIERVAASHHDLVDVRISGQASEHHHLGGKRARIAGRARGTQVVAVRDAISLELAVDEAVDTFERELRKLAKRSSQPDRRRAQSAAEPPEPEVSLESGMPSSSRSMPSRRPPPG